MIQNITNHAKLISKAYKSLSDDESREVFEAKMNWILDHDDCLLLDWFLERQKTVYCPEIEEYEKSIGKDGSSAQGYLLFGAGMEGIKAKKILEACDRKVLAFCDNQNSLWGKTVEDIKIISPASLLHEYSSVPIIITPRAYQLEIYKQLLMIGYPRENIIIPQNGFLLGFSGNQYFDFWQPAEDEVFIDAGCLNGETSTEFVKWCNGNYSKIHAFEPDQICWETCIKKFKEEKIDKVEFHKQGTWKYTDTLYFKSHGQGGSRICSPEQANMKIDAAAIDDVLNGEPITLIKLDVEGSEYETLIGARESIKKYKPRLAVSAYHKPDDLWTLIDLILELNSEYRIYLRHYSTCSYETVIYAY